MERLRIGKATPGEVLGSAEWVSPMATAMTIQNETPTRGLSFRQVLVSPVAHYNK